MDKREEDLKILEISQWVRKHHNDALWEAEKHFTWWVSIVFPSLILVYTNAQLCPLQKAVLITLGSLFGIFLAIIGFVVVRKEGEYFKESIETVNRTSQALGLNKPPSIIFGPTLPLMPDYEISESFEEARNKANKKFMCLLRSILPHRSTPDEKGRTDCDRNLGIRDCFQLVFVFSGLLFFFICIITWITLWPDIRLALQPLLSLL